MKHVNDTLAVRWALGETSPEEAREVEIHIGACPRCRELLSATRDAWAVMETDPASTLPDTPLWPRVAEALDRPGAADPMPVLRPRWRIAAGEALHAPVAYAGMGLVVLGLAGGHVAGRALLGEQASTAEQGTAAVGEDMSEGAEALDLSALLDLPSGSLAEAYLGEDMAATSDATAGETQR